jgi:hypothetical protein
LRESPPLEIDPVEVLGVNEETLGTNAKVRADTRPMECRRSAMKPYFARFEPAMISFHLWW